VGLDEELDAAAQAGSAYGEVSGVLAADSVPGLRAYLVCLDEAGERGWLVLDASLAPVADRERVHEVASIVVLCELAVELAAGGQLEALQARLAELREREDPGGLAAAQAAAAELEAVVGVPPRLASPAYLDRLGAATRRLEQELGEHASPLASALATHTGTVQAFVAEVDGRHKVPLR
jgi:hypothetical protein